MRPWKAGLGWLVAAVVATLVGLGGIRLVGDSLTGTPGGVLSEDDVERALATPPSGGPSGSGPAATTPSGGPQRSFTVTGGSAIARCLDGDRAYLVSWSPAQGYQVTEHDQGPDDDVDVRFAGPDGFFEISVTCRGGTPALADD